MEDKKVKGLKVRVLDDIIKNLGLTVSTSNLESYFGRKDGEAFAKVEIFKEGKTKPENVYFLARGKYISRVTKYLTQNNISNNPVIMSREQANKTWAKSLGIKFDVFEVKDNE